MEMYIANGHLTKDAELKIRNIGDTQVKVCNFTVAVNRRKATSKRDENGKRVFDTLVKYVRVALWRDQAEALAPYLKQGREVLVQGEPDLDIWLNAEKQNVPEIKLTSPVVTLLGASKKGDAVTAPAETAAVVNEPEEDDDSPFED